MRIEPKDADRARRSNREGQTRTGRSIVAASLVAASVLGSGRLAKSQDAPAIPPPSAPLALPAPVDPSVLPFRPSVIPVPGFSGQAFNYSDLKQVEIQVPGRRVGKSSEDARQQPPEFPVELKDWDEAVKSLTEARQLQKSGEWRKALEGASRAIRLAPEFVEAYRLRANVYASIKLHRRAIADYSRVIQLNPIDIWAYMNRGYFACKDRDFEHGLADLDHALELCESDSDRARVLSYRGRSHVVSGNPLLALADFQRSIELGEVLAEPFREVGQILARLGEHDRAIENYDRSLAINSTVYSYYDRARSRLAQGNFAQAQADFERAIEIDPKGPWYHEGRGWSRLAQGQVDRAIEDFSRALALAPDFRKALTSRGWAYLARRDIDRAIADFEAASQLQQPGKLWWEFGWNWSLALMPKYDHAIVGFQERCCDFPNMRWALISAWGDEARSQSLPSPYFDLCLVSRILGRSEIAPTLIVRVVATWETFPDAWVTALGRAFAAAKRSDWVNLTDSFEAAARFSFDALTSGALRPSLKGILEQDGSSSR